MKSSYKAESQSFNDSLLTFFQKKSTQNLNYPYKYLQGFCNLAFVNLTSSFVTVVDKKKRLKSVKKPFLKKPASTKKTVGKKKLEFSLTKKQKQKLKLSKLYKLIRPYSDLFRQYAKVERKKTVTNSDIGLTYLVHDGYSWYSVCVDRLSVGYKFGALHFKTKAISHVPLLKKGGKKKLKMAQQTNFRVKTMKVKRKK